MRLTTLTLLAVWVREPAPPLNSAWIAETGLRTWQTDTRGIQVRLTQISPDQVRAFYQARGFSAAAAEHYVTECVFMTVVRNIGDTPIQHRLADWRYVAPGQPARAIRSKTEWARRWKQQGVNEAARIAFTWAQFPCHANLCAGRLEPGHDKLQRTARRPVRPALHLAQRRQDFFRNTRASEVRQ